MLLLLLTTRNVYASHWVVLLQAAALFVSACVNTRPVTRLMKRRVISFKSALSSTNDHVYTTLAM